VLSGARSALGVDVDAQAVEVARANAELNRLADRCSFSTAALAELETVFDLVVANLEAPVLLELAPALAEKLGPGARLVVTGSMIDRRDELLARLRLPLEHEQRAGDWCLLELGS
jgi:ribosomal protein L11 methyltransferase